MPPWPLAARWTTDPARLALLGAGFAAILVSRHPAVLLHADFWGEDGWVWFPDAYYHGWPSLLWPHTGYLQTVSRLGGLLAQLVPLAWAPTLFALLALAIQSLPPVFLVSARMAHAWPNARARLAFALLYVALPNSYEVFVNLTNAQWHLAVLAFLIVASAPPVTRAGWVFDSALLLLSGLSGPFCLLLLPVAAWQAWCTRTRAGLWRLSVLAAAAVVQVGYLLDSIDTRTHAPLGAGPRRLARIVALNVVLAVLVGQRRLPGILQSGWWQDSNAAPLAVTAAAVALAALACWSGPMLLRQFGLFAGATFAASLIRPQVSDSKPQWPIMTLTGWGDRYYILPMLAWVGVLFALAGSAHRTPRLLAGALIVLMLAGVAGDFVYPSMATTHFAAQARVWQAAPPGTTLTLPIHPDGAVMQLTRQP